MPSLSLSPLTGSIYSGEVIADSPAAYWRLGETSGTTADDERNLINGTYTGGVTLGSAGAVQDGDKAASFDGTDDYVSVGDNASLSFANNTFTIEFWADFTDTASRGVLGKRGAPWEYSIHTSAGALVVNAWNSAGSDVYQITGLAIGAGWHHWVWTADGTTARVYKDTVEVGSAAKSANNMEDTSSPLEIGRAGGGGAPLYMYGLLDEVAIYPTVLSTTRISRHYNAATPLDALAAGSLTLTPL